MYVDDKLFAGQKIFRDQSLLIDDEIKMKVSDEFLLVFGGINIGRDDEGVLKLDQKNQIA